MAMKRQQDARAAPDCRKLDILADVCRMFLAAERRKKAVAAAAAVEPACKKRKFLDLALSTQPLWLRLPPPTGPAVSDFHPRFRGFLPSEKKRAESSYSGPAALVGHQTLVVRRLEPACKKRKSPPRSPPSLRLPPTTGPALSDFRPRFRDVSSCEKKPAEYSSDSCLATLLGPASKKIKLKIVSSGAGAASSSNSSSSSVPSSGDGPRGSWEVEHVRLGGERPVWIGDKLITGSDKTKSQSRLLVPQSLSQRIFQQARDWECARINSAGLPVLVLDRIGRHHQMVCKFRASQNGMVFTGGWNEFVRINSLQIGDLLGIVAFRSADALCFAFLPRDQD